jgi:hypothetical protein
MEKIERYDHLYEKKVPAMEIDSAITAPTERSIPPAIIDNVIPMLTTPRMVV